MPVIETLAAGLLLSAGKRLLRAAVEGRDLESSDASEIVVAFLDALVKSQQQTELSLERLEAKLDRYGQQHYSAAMHAGTRLLRDAAPAHRNPQDRRSMLNDARLRFADAAGLAGDAVRLAQAETMYGMTWAALGSPQDLREALVRAIQVLQREVVITFQLKAQDNRTWERSDTAFGTRLRTAVIGPSVPARDWSNTNRFDIALAEHMALWKLREMAGETGPYPFIPRPHGSVYSHPRPGLPIRLEPGQPADLLGVSATLSSDGLGLTNRSGGLVRAALTGASLGPHNVISPDMSALDVRGTPVPDGSRQFFGRSQPSPFGLVNLSMLGRLQQVDIEGPAAACVSLGREEGVDLAVLLHSERDWSFSRGRT